jgi:hypothetical protein
MLNGHKSPLITGNKCRVLCQATVDLISCVQRPYLFKVTVTGQPPHDITRVYDIAAVSDDAAARLGIDTFVKEMESPHLRLILDS